MGTNNHFWKIYIWVFCVVSLLSAVGRVVLFFKKRGLVSMLDIVEADIGLLAIPALLGFAYHYRVGLQWPWMILTVVITVMSIYQFFTPKMSKLYEKGWLMTTGAIALQTVIGVPALWALIRYSFF